MDNGASIELCVQKETYLVCTLNAPKGQSRRTPNPKTRSEIRFLRKDNSLKDSIVKDSS